MEVWELKWAFRAVIELHFYLTQRKSLLWAQLKKIPLLL